MTIDAHGGNTFAYSGVRYDFSVNLNPLGMQKPILDAVRDNAETFDAYPDTRCRALRRAAGEREGLPEDYFVFGNGAADIIVRLCMALKPKKALVTAPTFSEYEAAVTLAGGQTVRYALSEAENFQVTPAYAQAVTADTDLVFLCQPNNPTGQLAASGTVEALLAACRQAGARLVIDECFLEFTGGQSAKAYLADNPHLILLKAFTKMYSMAGLRLGYCLCADSAVTEAVAAWGQSWSVSAPAQVAGIAACAMTEHPMQTRAYLETERPWLMQQLGRLVKVYPADGNFILFRAGPDLWQKCMDRGVMLRSCANFHGLGEDFYRIGIQSHSNNLELLRTLEEIFSESR